MPAMDTEANPTHWTLLSLRPRGQHAPMRRAAHELGATTIALSPWALRARGDATPCLFLTTFDDSDLLLRATAAGAQGFLLKDAAPEDLREAIVRIVAGQALLQPVSTDPVRQRYRYHADDAPRELFSQKEVAVLRLMAGGYSNREIAGSLFLAEGTVKNYVSAILDKLDTRDRTRAVLKAITLRII